MAGGVAGAGAASAPPVGIGRTGRATGLTAGSGGGAAELTSISAGGASPVGSPASPAAAATASWPAAKITPALAGSVDAGAAGSEVTDGSGTAGSAGGFAGSCAAAAAMLPCTQTAATSVRSLRHKAVRVQQGKAQMWCAPARPASLLLAPQCVLPTLEPLQSGRCHNLARYGLGHARSPRPLSDARHATADPA